MHYTEQLQKLLAGHADLQKAAPMKAYMKDHFEFLGIKTPERNTLLREFWKQTGMPEDNQLEAVVRELWSLPEREYQYAAMALLDKYKKRIKPDSIILTEFLITEKSWWDTVDLLAGHHAGAYLAAFPEKRPELVRRWLDSDNIWLQRTAILFQLKYKKQTDTALLFSIIEELQESKEFFIRKAIGWALREYAKTDSECVVSFVHSHALSPLSVREALKHAGKATG